MASKKTVIDIAAGIGALFALFWLGKKMDKRFYKLVGKRHRFDYK